MNTQDLFKAFEHAARVAAAHGETCPAALAAFLRLERAVDEHNAQANALTLALARARAMASA